MNAVRISICLAILAMGAIGKMASAQDQDPNSAPGRASVQGGSYDLPERDPWDPRFRLRSDIGDGVGYERGYQTFGGFLPFWSNPNQSLFFVDPRIIVPYDGDFAANVGVGLRHFNEDTNRIFGASFWYDHDNSHLTQYHQYGISLESLGKYFDMRLNAYLPNNVSRVQLSQSIGGPFFIGNNIGFDRTTVVEQAMRGGDFEIGGALPYLGDLGLRTYIGAYLLDAPGVEGTVGTRFRADALVTQDAAVQVGVTNDQLFGTNVTGAVTLSFPFTRESRWFRRPKVPSRLYSPTERSYRVPVYRRSESDYILATNPADNLPFRVAHVNNANALAGTGTFETPFNTLPASVASDFDIIFINRGTGTSVGMTTGITLQANQRLLGQGLVYSVTAVDRTFSLPGFSAGVFPSITNLAGNAITLANNNEVAGLNIAGAAGAGIAGTGISGFNIHDVSVTTSSGGVNLANATGIGTITNATLSSNRASGLTVNNSSGSPFNLSVATSTLNSNTGSGVNLTASGGSNLTTTITGSTINDNTVHGIALSANSGTQSLTIGGAAVALGNTITGNFDTGLDLQLSGTASAVLSAQNNTIGGIGLAATMLLTGDLNTAATPFSIVTDAFNSQELAQLLVDISPTNIIFNPTAPSGQVFTPLAGTGTTTGLTTVNGLLTPFALTDLTSSLAMVFNDFDPAETFSWDTGVTRVSQPTNSTGITADQLIGSRVTLVAENGRTIPGTLQAVTGNPTAAQFIPLSGNTMRGIRVDLRDTATLTSGTIANNTISSIGSIVNGSTLLPQMAGIQINQSAGTSIQSLSINNNQIVDNHLGGQTHGIVMNNTLSALTATISGNSILNNSGYGIQFNDDSGVNSLTVTGNTFDNRVGVAGVLNQTVGNRNAAVAVFSQNNSLLPSTYAITNNTIRNTLLGTDTNPDTNGDGILMSLLGGTSAVNHVVNATISGNTLSGNAGQGIRVQRGDFVALTSGITGNSITGTATSLDGISARAFGSALASPNNVNISNNVIDASRDGIALDTEDNVVVLATISGNTVTNSRDSGIRVTSINDSAVGNPVTGVSSVLDGNILTNNGTANPDSGILFSATDRAHQNVLVSGTSRRSVLTGNRNGITINNTSDPGPTLVIPITDRYVVQGTDIIDSAVDGVNVVFGGLDNLTIGGAAAGQNVTIGRSVAAIGGDDGIDITLLPATLLGATEHAVTIQNTTISRSGDDGITVNATGTPGGMVSAINIANSTITLSGDDGVVIRQTSGVVAANITNSNITNNLGRGVDIFVTNTAAARMFLTDAVYNIGALGQGNNISGNGQQGIVFDTLGVTVPQVPAPIFPLTDISTGFTAVNYLPATTFTAANFDLASPDFAVATLLALDNQVRNNGADGLVVSVGTNTRQNVLISGNSFGGNAFDDLFVYPTASINPQNSVDDPNILNPDQVVQDPVAHLNLVFGAIDTNANNIPDTARINIGEQIAVTTAGLAGTNTITRSGLFTNADPFKGANRSVRGAFNVQIDTLLDLNTFVQLGTPQNMTTEFSAFYQAQPVATIFYPGFSIIPATLFPQ
jgi:hypothetical protein